MILIIEIMISYVYNFWHSESNIWDLSYEYLGKVSKRKNCFIPSESDIFPGITPQIWYYLVFDHINLFSLESRNVARFRECEEGANRGAGEHSIKFGWTPKQVDRGEGYPYFNILKHMSQKRENRTFLRHNFSTFK